MFLCQDENVSLIEFKLSVTRIFVFCALALFYCQQCATAPKTKEVGCTTSQLLHFFVYFESVRFDMTSFSLSPRQRFALASILIISVRMVKDLWAYYDNWRSVSRIFDDEILGTDTSFSRIQSGLRE